VELIRPLAAGRGTGLGDSDAVLVVDEIGDLKKGSATVGGAESRAGIAH
jgi:hypothetical protein